MKKYIVNLNLINAVIPAVCKDRYYLGGVNIKDVDGFRHYTATNGHILLHTYEAYEGDALENPITIGITKTMKNKCLKNGEMVIVDDDTVVIKYGDKTVCDIIDHEYPEYERILNDAGDEKAPEYASFNPAYYKIIGDFIPKAHYMTPLMKSRTSPAKWCYDYEGTKFEAILMPIRLED